MSTIDERVVQMRFDNAQFEKGIKDTTQSLGNLKNSLNFDSAKMGIASLGSSIQNGISLDKISESVTNLGSKFTALAGAGVIALGNIATQAIATGTRLIKSLTVDPITSGLSEYEMNLNGIQTILANTKKKGENLKTVGAALDDLNAYSDKTIYNFGQMVNGIKTLTTAGADLKTGVNTVKGFANAAALAGVGAEQMAGALTYGLNQAITKGRMMAQDWMSLESSGIAGEGFKNSILETARVNGVAVDAIIKKSGSFRESLSKGWLTADILQQTLAKYTGELTDAQLKKLGYTEKQIKAIQQTAQDAISSATKVKTLSQLISTLQEAAQSGWSKSWTYLFGDLNEAIDLFTNISNVIGGMIGASADARNKMLGDWKALGGRQVVIDALGNAFKILMSIVKVASDAFKEIFPPTTGKQLNDLSKSFKSFIDNLKPSPKMLDNIKSTFKGLFAVLDIGWMIIKGVFSVLGTLVDALFKSSDGVLEITGNIGDFLVLVRDSIKNGTAMGNVFKFISAVLKYPIDLFKQLTGAIATNQSASEGWSAVWDNIVGVFKGIWTFIKPAVDWLVSGLKIVADATINFFKTMDFGSFAAVIAGLGAGAFGLGVIRLIQWIRDTFGVLKIGIVDQLQGVLGTLKTYLGSLQQNVNSKTIMNIATSLVILAAAILILSFIPIDKLATAMTAITYMLGQMIAVMILFDKQLNPKSAFKLAAAGAAMILISTAMVIFAAAVTIMAKLSWEELAKGLIGMAAALTIMIIASKVIAKNIGNMVASAFAILVLSNSLLVLGLAIKLFGNLSWDEIAKGLISITASLLLIGLALRLMPENMPVLALSLIVISTALTILAGAMKIMGSMSWDEIGRGLTVLAGSLLILAGALYLMEAALPGAAALILAAVALAILAPALLLMGKMSWDEIGKGLLVLAVSLAVIAGAGYLLIGALPGLIGLGIAAALIGVGILAAGAGIMLMSLALVALGAASSVGVAAITAIAIAVFNLIPLLAQKIGEGFIAIVNVIANSGKELINAFTTVLTALVTAIKNVAPLVINTIFDIIMLLVTKLEQNVPKFVTSGLNMVIGILDGVAKGLPKLMEKGTDIIVAYIRGIKDNLPRVVTEGFNTVLAFIDGLTNAIKVNAPKLRKSSEELGWAILDGITNGLSETGRKNGILGLVNEIGARAVNGFKDFWGIKSPSRVFHQIGVFAMEGLSNGISSYSNKVVDSVTNVGAYAVDGLKKAISNISDLSLTDVNMNPTITPVLDLTNVKNSSALISSMLTPSTISVSSSYSKASAISMDTNAALQDTTQQIVSKPGDTNISFIQTNNSPKALSASEIYRQTKNQISAAKAIVATV